jgi:hypothetical protein
VKDRNIVWPILLIVVGVLFLAYNLGFLRFSQLMVATHPDRLGDRGSGAGQKVSYGLRAV